MQKIQAFIEKIENSKMSFWTIASSLFIIMFLRTFLENYANSLNSYRLSGFVDTFFHYPFWFFVIFLSIFIIANILTKENILKIAKVVTVFSFVLTMPPIVDLLINKGKQIPYLFIVGSYPELFQSFFTYFGGKTVGIGIKTEVAIALMGLGFYIYQKTKKVNKAVLGMFLLYSTIFIMLALPTFIFGFKNIILNENLSVNTNSVVNFWYKQEPQNAVTVGRTFVLDVNTFNSPLTEALNQSSITISIILLVINLFLLSFCFFLYSPQKFFAVLKNFRYLRIFHYFIMVSVGVYFGVIFLGKNPIGSLFDLVSFVSLYLAMFFAWLFAVWENDEVDVEIDKISNQSRPLATREPVVPREEWENLKYTFLFFSLSFAFLCGFYSFILTLLFIFIYHIYSTPPLKLKRFLGVSSLLIAINALLAVWMGFFISSGTEDLNAFPVRYIFGILIIFILVENVKNIKDIEGDKKEGITTLPVLLGEKRGKLIIGLCVFLGALLVPFIFYLNLFTFLLAIFFGLILFILTNKKRFEEKYIFLTYFLYIITFFILINV